MRGIINIGVIVCLGLTACGGGAGDETELTRFTGTWSIVSGTVTEVCPGLGSSTTPLTGNVVWSRGLSSDLVQSSPSSSCVINADVRGTTASGSGPPCVVTVENGSVTLTVTGYTFVISADGRTAQENQSATAVINGNGGSLTCTLNATASYQKLSQ
jgi:hypothetical protein